MQSALERDDALAMLGIGPCHHATRCALAAVPMTSAIHRPFTPVNAGCTPVSSGNTEQPRRPSDAALGCSGEPGVQPRVQRPVVASDGAGDRVSSESAAGRSGAHSSPSIASACRHSSADCIERSSFGDFSLARQRKVTRPAGADSRLTATSRKDSRKSNAGMSSTHQCAPTNSVASVPIYASSTAGCFDTVA